MGVVGVGEAETQSIDFFAQREDVGFEALAVGFEGFGVEVEVDFAVRESDAHAAGLVGGEDGGSVGEELDENLVIVDEGVVAEQKWVLFAVWEALQVASDGRDDSD